MAFSNLREPKKLFSGTCKKFDLTSFESSNRSNVAAGKLLDRDGSGRADTRRWSLRVDRGGGISAGAVFLGHRSFGNEGSAGAGTYTFRSAGSNSPRNRDKSHKN